MKAHLHLTFLTFKWAFVKSSVAHAPSTTPLTSRTSSNAARTPCGGRGGATGELEWLLVRVRGVKREDGGTICKQVRTSICGFPSELPKVSESSRKKSPHLSLVCSNCLLNLATKSLSYQCCCTTTTSEPSRVASLLF